MFLKQQQWRITCYSVTAYGALIAVAKTIAASFDEKVFLSFLVVAVAYGVSLLRSFIESFDKFRGRVSWVKERYFTKEELSQLHLDEPKTFLNREGFVWWLIVGCIFGAMLAILAIWLPLHA